MISRLIPMGNENKEKAARQNVERPNREYASAQLIFFLQKVSRVLAAALRHDPGENREEWKHGKQQDLLSAQEEPPQVWNSDTQIQDHLLQRRKLKKASRWKATEHVHAETFINNCGQHSLTYIVVVTSGVTLGEKAFTASARRA